jgi:sigma-E factor negative regulatory protein RseB
MRRGLVLAVAGGVSLAALQAPAPAATRKPEQQPQSRPDDGIAMLERAAAAARRLSYSGTQMVSFWTDNGSTSALIGITHVGGEGLLLRVAPTPQNPGGAVYDDEGGEVPEVVGFAKGTLDLLASHYDVAVEGGGEVAGRTAYVVTVRRPGSSPSARFWIDRATSLTLRREVLDGEGRTVRESAFIEVSIGQANVSEVVVDQAASMPPAPGAPTDVGALRDAGWHVPDRLGSDLALFDARVSGSGRDEVLHLSYSDGVTTASVFEQRGLLDTAAVQGWPRETIGGETVYVQGSFPRRVVWSGGETVFTVVADCPRAALDDLVATLPHGEPGRGIGDRLESGLGRVGSWFNPFA